MRPPSAMSGGLSGGIARVWAEFWRGFSEPSRTAFFVMLASFAAMLALTLWFFSPGTLAGPMGRYLATSAATTHRALRLAAEPATGPRLLVIGTSASEQGLASERDLTARLREATGDPGWEAYLLTNPRQSPLDQLAILETVLGPAPDLAPDPAADLAAGPGADPVYPVVVVIGANMMRPSWGAPLMIELEQMGRLGLRSDWADAEMRRLGAEPRPRTGFYPLDNRNFVMLNASRSLLRLLTFRPATPGIAHYAPAMRMPVDKRPRMALAERARAAAAPDALVWGIYARLAQKLRAWPQVRLAFYEEPLAPDFITEMGFSAQKAAFEARMAAFAAANGAVWWPMLAEAQIGPEAFRDDLHLADPEAQARLRAVLVRWVAEAVTS